MEQSEVSFRTLGASVWRSKFLFLAVTLLPLVAGVAYLAQTPKVYRSEQVVTSTQPLELTHVRRDKQGKIEATPPLRQPEILDIFIAQINQTKFQSQFLDHLNAGLTKENQAPLTLEELKQGILVRRYEERAATVAFHAATAELSERVLNEIGPFAMQAAIEDYTTEVTRYTEIMERDLAFKESVYQERLRAEANRLANIAKLAGVTKVGQDGRTFLEVPGAEEIADIRSNLHLLQMRKNAPAMKLGAMQFNSVITRQVEPRSYSVLATCLVAGILLGLMTVLLAESPFVGFSPRRRVSEVSA